MSDLNRPFLPGARHVVIPLVLILVGLAGACRQAQETRAPAVSENTWAVVDGAEITRDDVERAYRRAGPPQQPLSNEEALAARLSLLNELIVQELLLARARALQIELPESELDTEYLEARKNIPDEAFQQELARRNLTAADMREGLRRELLAQKVIEREVGSGIEVTDQEITAYFEANRAQFNLQEDAYRLAQIVVTPSAEERVANRTGDNAATPQAAAAKAKMLMARLDGGASFRDLAMDYSEDPESAPRGGDLGFVPASALQQAPPPLRDAVLKTTPGNARLVSAGGIHTIVLVVAQEKAGQRDLSTPGVRENITEQLRGRKEQLLRAAYLTSLQSDADVANHLARRVVESRGTAPVVVTTAPAPAP
jgi:peptidyl-prolyl cis-trans isomerase SurA